MPPYKGIYSNCVLWNTLSVRVNNCSGRKWEAKKGFWRENKEGQAGLKKDKGDFPAELSEPLHANYEEWREGTRRLETETAAILPNGQEPPTASEHALHLHIHIYHSSEFKNQGYCSAQNIPRWDIGYLPWSPHCKSTVWKKPKNLSIQIKKRSIGVKRPGFKSLFFHSLAVQPWIS